MALLEEGNIDLTNRPIVHNPDGTISTVRSISIGVGNTEVLIPTVINGKVVSDDEAIQHYFDTGEHLGIFSDVESANKYAEELHNKEEERTMLTDQKQTGVPNGSSFNLGGIKSRTQFVKPTQTYNMGKAAAANPLPSQSTTNPLLKRTNGQPNAVATGQRPLTAQEQADWDIQRYGYPTGMTDANGEELYQGMGTVSGRFAKYKDNDVVSNPIGTKSNFEQARSYIGKLSDDEIISLLDELASGALRGYDTTITGEPGSALSQNPEYTPAQPKSTTTSLADLVQQKGLLNK